MTKSNTSFALLENTKMNNGECFLFDDFVDEIRAGKQSEIDSAFTAITTAQQQGYYIVGYCAYELGLLLLTKLERYYQEIDIPLLHFLVFKQKKVLNSHQKDAWLKQQHDNGITPLLYQSQFDLTKSEYKKSFKDIADHLKAGDSYQVNYSGRYHFLYQGNTLKLYQQLCGQQHVEFSAYLNFQDYAVISLSPELFFKKQDSTIYTRPMKGTIARSNNAAEDKKRKQHLENDEKNRAENIMIVDLLRNDLSRIAKPATVKTDDIFKIETYETVHQMTTTVSAEVDPDINFKSLIKALFPCGSITGAPKIRTMEIIAALEKSARGIYTGTIGYITPDNDYCFSVAIRTLLAKNQQAQLGVGGGITIASNYDDEWQEMHLKADFATKMPKNFSLISAISLNKLKKLSYLEYHLQRLQSTATVFSFQCDVTAIESALIKEAEELPADDYKLRVQLESNGAFSIEAKPINSPAVSPVRIVLSKHRINQFDILWQYKTTAASTRGFYQKELKRLQQQYDCFDVIFRNQEQVITEATGFNLIIEKDGQYYTSPASSGLLPGIYRQQLLDKKQCLQKSLTLNDLQTADNIYLINSVRGLIKAQLIEVDV